MEYYSAQMLNGEWNENTGIPIVFSTDGILIDGQHRLLAVIQSGVSVYFVINHSGTQICKNYIDIGAKRTAANILEMTGVANSNCIAAGLKSYVKQKKGYSISSSSSYGNSPDNASQMLDSSNNAIEELYYSSPNRWQNVHNKSVQFYNGIYKSITPSFIFSTYAILTEINNELSDIFCNKLFMSLNLNNDDPEYHLRSFIVSNHNSVKKHSSQYINNCFAITWNMRYDKESCTSLKKLTHRANRAVEGGQTIKLNGYNYKTLFNNNYVDKFNYSNHINI